MKGKIVYHYKCMKVNALCLYLFLAALSQVLVPIVSVVMLDPLKAENTKKIFKCSEFFYICILDNI